MNQTKLLYSLLPTTHPPTHPSTHAFFYLPPPFFLAAKVKKERSVDSGGNSKAHKSPSGTNAPVVGG